MPKTSEENSITTARSTQKSQLATSAELPVSAGRGAVSNTSLELRTASPGNPSGVVTVVRYRERSRRSGQLLWFPLAPSTLYLEDHTDARGLWISSIACVFIVRVERDRPHLAMAKCLVVLAKELRDHVARCGA